MNRRPTLAARLVGDDLSDVRLDWHRWVDGGFGRRVQTDLFGDVSWWGWRRRPAGVGSLVLSPLHKAIHL